MSNDTAVTDATPASLRFSELSLAEPVLVSVEAAGYVNPSPIQAQSIPPLLEGGDVLGQAQTGTGKTAAFALPLLSRLDTKNRKAPQILVMAPTRELASQVAEAMMSYGKNLKGLKVATIYGGAPVGPQIRSLKEGAQVVVGTPGRLIDLIDRRVLNLSELKAVVLDEADEMLRMGFIDDVERILDEMPEDKQVALFSATMPPEVWRIAKKHLKQPTEIRIESKTTTADSIRQSVITVMGYQKVEALDRVLETVEHDAVIIFVRTKAATVDVADALADRGYSVAALNGDLDQEVRERTVDRLKKGKLDIVVATDVAARGLDVSRISHVINYDIPFDTESYVHRIGRTGRAGREGAAILLAQPKEKRFLRNIERATSQPMEHMDIPSGKVVAEQRVEKFNKKLKDTIESKDLAFYEKLVADWQEAGIDTAKAAAALVFLQQQERPLQPSKQDVFAGKKKEKHQRNNDGPTLPRGPRNGAVAKGWDRYRVEVGRDHGVWPKNLVGAIANESGLRGGDIHNISIQAGCSFVDLPEGMPKDVFMHLKKVTVCNQELQIRKWTPNPDGQYSGGGAGRSKPPFKKHAHRDSPGFEPGKKSGPGGFKGKGGGKGKKKDHHHKIAKIGGGHGKKAAGPKR